MITATMKEILNAMNPQLGQDVSPLARLAGVTEPEKAWRVAYAIDELENAARHYEKMHKALLQKLGTPDKTGREYTLDEEAQKTYAKKLEAILSYPLELDIEKLPRAYADEARLPATDLLALRFLIEYDAAEHKNPFENFQEEE